MPGPDDGFRYRLAERSETVGGRVYRLVGLADFEQTVTELCDHVLRDGGSARWFEDLCPMFGALWPSARALARVVAEEGPGLAGLRVLEFGCGLGLPSLVAAAHQARVVATDQHPDTASFLARNLSLNGVDGVRFVSFDWRGPTPPEAPERSFHRVLASDVLYARHMPPLVAETFDRFLGPAGVGWLADPGRPWLQEFADEARARGFAVSVDVVAVEAAEAFVLRVERG